MIQTPIRLLLTPTSLKTKLKNNAGSILIWTVLLGFVLTSVFFFFSVRQRKNVLEQRDTADILDIHHYLESLADYMEKNPEEFSNSIDEGAVQISVTQNSKEIIDHVQTGESKTYTFADEIFINWNACKNTEGGDLLIDDTLYESSGSCGADNEYKDTIGPINVNVPFTIKTTGEPFNYRITSSTNKNMKDLWWQMNLSTNLEYGKEITVSRRFK